MKIAKEQAKKILSSNFHKYIFKEHTFSFPTAALTEVLEYRKEKDRLFFLSSVHIKKISNLSE